MVLHRDPVEPGGVPDVLARMVPDLVRRTGSRDDASAVLTAARDVSRQGLE